MRHFLRVSRLRLITHLEKHDNITKEKESQLFIFFVVQYESGEDLCYFESSARNKTQQLTRS